MANGTVTSGESGVVYLQNLQDLALEMTVAIHAISANALARLEDSVAKQEMLCASLATMEAAVLRELCAQSGPDGAVATKIRATGETVRTLNMQYASLLRHSGKSIAVLSSLCRNHTGQFEGARGARSKHQTWSCEM